MDGLQKHAKGMQKKKKAKDKMHRPALKLDLIA